MTDPMIVRGWLSDLEKRLERRRSTMELMDSYYRGDHPLPFVTRAHAEKFRNEFRQMLEDSRSNFMRLVIDATEERLSVEGFRLSGTSDMAADRATWDIWQANGMDSQSQVGFLEALTKGVSYLSVWESDGRYPSIAVEDGTQTIVGYEPGSNYMRRAAALKVWRDDWTGRDRANVFMPNGIYKFERMAAREVGVSASVTVENENVIDPRAQRFTVVRADSLPAEAAVWVQLPDPDGFVPNRLGVVPIVPLRNRPRLLVEGESEIADVYRVQNQINGFLFLLALAGYFGAHRQRWAAGIKFVENDDGTIKDPWDSAIDRLWATENPDARFGDFEETSLDGYIKAIEQKVLHIAVTTRTPRHYLIEQGQSPSGDAIEAAESGLVKKVVRKQKPFGEGLEEALRIARLFAGEPDAPVDSEVEWGDAKVQTVAQITDAAIKRFAAGIVPWQQTMSDLGYSPQQIARSLEAFGGVPPKPQTTMPAGALPPAA